MFRIFIRMSHDLGRPQLLQVCVVQEILEVCSGLQSRDEVVALCSLDSGKIGI